MISQSVENFLKNVYHLQDGDNWVTTTVLADKLGQRPASVTNMLQKLASSEMELIQYVPYKGVRLHPNGEMIALEVIRHHRLVELYLSKALGVPWDRVHEEAEKLEHVLSDDVEDRMAAALDDVSTDPHGSPIPTKDGQIARVDSMPLSEIDAGQTVRILEVNDDDSDLLRYLGDLKLYPGTDIEIVNREPFGDSLTIRHDGRELSLGEEATPHVFVSTTTRKKR